MKEANVNVIKILGSPGYKGRKYSDDNSTIVFLTDGFYHKDDHKSVAKVDGKYYRTESPLISKLTDSLYNPNEYELIEKTVIINGLTYRKIDCYDVLVYVDGGLHQRMISPMQRRGMASSKAIMADGRVISFYSRGNHTGSEGMFVYDMYSGILVEKTHPGLIEYKVEQLYIGPSMIQTDRLLNDGSIKGIKQLHINIDKGFTLIPLKLVYYKGGYYNHSSVAHSYDLNGNKVRVVVSAKELFELSPKDREKLRSEALNVVSMMRLDSAVMRKGSTSSLASMISCITSTKLTKVSMDKSISEDSLHYSKILKCSTNIADIDELIEYISERVSKDINDVYSGVSDYYKGVKPLIIDFNYRNQGGNHLHHESTNRELEVSKSSRKVGKIGYTFGVELETSYGLLPLSLIDRHGLKAVGDRSIGSLEYVTSPLHGDAGIDKLREISEDLEKFCMVDKKCGIHVHVGGSALTESPKFNRRFSVYALKLGYVLQKELFSIVHPNRTLNVNREGISYCGLIDSKFKDVSMGNYKKILGRYIYGEDFSRDNNSKTRLFRWIQTRYKWLNLINCNSDNGGRSDAGTNSKFETIEFRLWDGTLNAEDIQNFVIISLAFTRFADCHQRLIDSMGDKIDLEFIIRTTIRNKDLKEKVINWIYLRKEKHLNEKIKSK